MQKLLAWAKQQGFIVSTATVGDVCVELVPVMRSQPAKPQGRAKDIYDEFGGELMDKIRKDEDLEPGLGS